MTRHFTKKWIGVAVLVTALAGAVWVFVQARQVRNGADADRASRRGLPVPVRTALVEEQAVEEVIGATALTVASQAVPIQFGSSQRGLNSLALDVRIAAVHVSHGARVKKGQLLFEVREDPFLALVKQQEALQESAQAEYDYTTKAVANNERIRGLDLTSAEAEIKFRTEDHKNKQALEEILARLHKSKAVTVTELYEARSKLTEARYALAEAERRLQRAKDTVKVGQLRDEADVGKAKSALALAAANLALARLDLDRCKVRSPIDGYVTVVNAVPGFQAEPTTVLTEVLQLEPIHVRMDFPQERADQVTVGQKAEVVLDSFPKETFKGTVVGIVRQVTPATRVFPVFIELKNPDHRIPAGVSGFARLRSSKTTLTVPATAVMQRESKAMVFRVQDGRARVVAVQTGPLLDVGLVELRRGLVAGDEVVIFGNQYLQDDDPVDTDWRKWARRE